MKKFNKKGFTLIELLVAITILGILSTIGVSAYTTYLKSARDAKRIGDIETLESAVTQYNFTKAKYPDLTDMTGLLDYLTPFPVDPRHGDQSTFSGANSAMDYAYTVGPDSGGVSLNGYELSTTFESENNFNDKANNDKDSGNDFMRYEKGSNVDKLKTDLPGGIGFDTLGCLEVSKVSTASATCQSQKGQVGENINTQTYIFANGK